MRATLGRIVHYVMQDGATVRAALVVAASPSPRALAWAGKAKPDEDGNVKLASAVHDKHAEAAVARAEKWEALEALNLSVFVDGAHDCGLVSHAEREAANSAHPLLVLREEVPHVEEQHEGAWPAHSWHWPPKVAA